MTTNVHVEHLLYIYTNSTSSSSYTKNTVEKENKALFAAHKTHFIKFLSRFMLPLKNKINYQTHSTIQMEFEIFVWRENSSG